ncbi:hypothetical protein Lepto7375DRAFT_5033 [Leptolyngbya sp. PCC 7375]|nr:hypothetical protein Lepto7375DRAFT_5033 [Leptolyngbya sp. PCC 7375]
MFLVLLETSGNQNYIFSTNKLRENVGASEATYRACSQWVLEAVTQITQQPLWDDNAEQLQSNLLNRSLNPPIEEEAANHRIEVIVAASGKAMVLTRELSDAKRIIQEVTLKALKHAPGLDVCGAIVEFDWGKESLAGASRRLHQQFEVVRSLKPSPKSRFLRLPIVEDCRTSGLPAADWVQEPDGLVAKSSVSLNKKKWANDALGNNELKINGRLPKLLEGSGYQFIKSTNELLNKQLEVEWLAVIHADGNGLGQIFIKLDQYIGATPPNSHRDRYFIDQFRQFSLELDSCTRKAFLNAIEVFPKDTSEDAPNPLKLVPLVLGGDDLTVVCDAKNAFAFTKAFLENFELHTQQSHVISRIAAKAFGLDELSGLLSACAGISIVKPHFPFSEAYQLAEELTKSAKVVKDVVTKNGQSIPCAAIDFHVLYDTQSTGLNIIREKLTFATEKTRLYNRPYIMSDIDRIIQMTGEQETLKQWLNSHHWVELRKRVNALRLEDDEGRRCLPNSQMHTLREGLFLGRKGADGQYELIRKRYAPQIDQIAASNDSSSLFWQDTENDCYATGLLDAMDIAEFWSTALEPQSEQ